LRRLPLAGGADLKTGRRDRALEQRKQCLDQKRKRSDPKRGGEHSREPIAGLGVCCGTAPHHIRAMAEALGRTPPASRYTADMSKHAFLGTDPKISDEYRELAKKL